MDDISGRGGEGGAAADGAIITDAGGVGDVAPPLEPICVRGGDPNRVYCDLVVHGEGFGRFEGGLVDVRHGTGTFQRLASGQTRVVDGSFSITLPQVQEIDFVYKGATVLFDANGDGVCSEGDQLFRTASTWFTVDGGQTCPASVPLSEQSMLRAVVAKDCAPSPDFCTVQSTR